MVARTQPRWQTLDWKRDLALAFTRPAELLAYLGLDPALAVGGGEAAHGFPLLVPRGFADLMEPGNAADPLLRQVLPLPDEDTERPGYTRDPVGDRNAVLAPGLLQKYPHRALLITTGACAVHCRYCFRRHFPYREETSRANRTAALSALALRPDIDEVILSGGDPLMLDDAALGRLLDRIEDIAHVTRLRLHTRLPVVLPSRITPALCERLAGSRLKTVVVIHANHPAELGAAAAAALDALGARRLLLLNQAVLLRGVNDDPDVLAALSERLFALGVRPYYLHMLDRVAGAAHFDVAEERARRLMNHLRARLSGYLMPRLAREVPGADSKVTLA